MITINSGMRGPLTARTMAECQSDPATTASMAEGYQRGQRHLGQINGIIGVKGLYRIDNRTGEITGSPSVKIFRSQGLEMMEKLSR